MLLRLMKKSNAQVMSAVKHMLYYFYFSFSLSLKKKSARGRVEKGHIIALMLLLQYACTSKHPAHALLFWIFFKKLFFLQIFFKARGRTILGKKINKKKCLGASRKRSCHLVHAPLPVWTPLQNPTPTQIFNIVWGHIYGIMRTHIWQYKATCVVIWEDTCIVV